MFYKKIKIETISDFMSSPARVVNSQTKCDQALEEMSKNKIKHLPVTSHGKIVGLLSERDLRTVCMQSPEKFSVSDIMTTDPYVVNNNEPLVKVVKEMQRRHIGCAIVQDVLGQPKGIFTMTDALGVLGKLLEPHQ